MPNNKQERNKMNLVSQTERLASKILEREAINNKGLSEVERITELYELDFEINKLKLDLIYTITNI